MKTILLFISFIVMYEGFSQKFDPLRKFFLEKKLITPTQLALHDTLMFELRKEQKEELEEAIKKAKTAEEKKVYQQQLKLLEQQGTFSPFMIDFDDDELNRDTLRKLASYFIFFGSGNYYSPGFVIQYGDNDSLAAETNKVAPDALIGFLSSIHAAGLITDLTEKRTKESIKKNEIGDSLSVIMKIMENQELETYFAPEMVKKILEKMQRIGVIRGPGVNKILALAQKNELVDPNQILAECEKAVVINLNDYPDRPEGYMQRVYEQIASVLPELGFTEFAVKVESYKSNYDTSLDYRTIVSLTNNGRMYSHSAFYSPADYDKNGRPDNEGKLGETFTVIFNQILKDRSSPFRIHRTTPVSDYGGRKLGILGFIALTKEQADSIHAGGSYLSLDYPNFRKPITSDDIKNAINTYKEIGLLTHLSAQELDSSLRVINEMEVNYYSDILSSFKNLVFEIDLEYGVNDKQYKEVKQNIALISKGNFNPTRIIDNYNYEKRQKFDYGFTLNGKQYITQLIQEDDWLDGNFWGLIEQAVSEQDKKGKFHHLYPSDGMRQIYLTHKQVEVLKQKKMIELTDPALED